jgi:hypothetical protein
MRDHCQHSSIGEPDAGNPPVRFGGRGGANQCAVPTPIRGGLARGAERGGVVVGSLFSVLGSWFLVVGSLFLVRCLGFAGEVAALPHWGRQRAGWGKAAAG